MSFIAKLYLDGEERNVLNAQNLYYQITDQSGKPSAVPNGGFIELSLEATKHDNLYWDWMLSSTSMKQGSLRFFRRDGMSKLFDLEFWDCYCIKLDENYSAIGNDPMTMSLTLSPGIVRMRGKTFEKPWKITDLTPVASKPLEDDDQEELKFIVNFKRKENSYKGEFGFDWFRSNFNETCTTNYEELKKEYDPITIQGKEYFPAWLSMFPNQNNVILRLETTRIEGDVQSDDIVRLPPQNGIRFEPEELPYNEADGSEITIICDTPLTKDTAIDIFNKKDEIVGKLNVFKNNDTLNLNLKFVKVCKSKHLEHLKEKFDRNINNIESYLKNRSLNQALIKPTVIDKNFESIEFINLDDFPDEMFGPGRISINRKGRNEIKRRCKSVKNFNGLIIFYLGVENTQSKAGDTQSYPLDEQFVFLYLNSVHERDVAHEIGHALGLEHTFIESSNYLSGTEKALNSYMEQLEKNKQYEGDPRYNQEKVNANILELENLIEGLNKKISDYKSIGQKNPHKFSKGKTTNMMDYVSSSNANKDFYHWQWLVMREEIKKYYNHQ